MMIRQVFVLHWLDKAKYGFQWLWTKSQPGQNPNSVENAEASETN